jgi:predicted dehydrogenase
MASFTHRYMPAVRYVHQLISEGYVGQPYHLNMRYYAGYGRESKYNWRFDADVSGAGVIANLGAHWLHLARWFFGDVNALMADSTRLVDRQPGPIIKEYHRAEDSATVALRFANGAQGNLHLSALTVEGSPYGQQHIEIHGSEGTIVVSMDWNQLQEVSGCRAGEKLHPLPIPDSIWTPHNTAHNVFSEQDAMTRDFINAIVSDQPVDPDFDEGARVQDLIEAAVTSAANGTRVQV